jgi:uncharacterized protein YjbJ (UPF0337 family)
MTTLLEIKGTWNITKGIMGQAWAEFTDDGLELAEGKQMELLGRIQKSTAETREALKRAVKQSYPARTCKITSEEVSALHPDWS